MRNDARSALTLVWLASVLSAPFGCGAGNVATPTPPMRASGARSDWPPPTSPPEELADPATLTVPGPAASPCTSDAMCLNHRCNLSYGKCAFPCLTDADCVRGTSCFKAVISTCQAKPPNAP